MCVIRCCERGFRDVSYTQRCRACAKALSVLASKTDDELDESERWATVLLERIRVVRSGSWKWNAA